MSKNYGFGNPSLDAAFGAMVGDTPAAAPASVPATDSVSDDSSESSASSDSDSSSATLDNLLSGALSDQSTVEVSSDESNSTEEPTEAAKPVASTPTDTVEFVKSGDRKIKIDYANKEATKKAYLMAEGMRKFQAERDAERAEKTALSKELQEMRDLWNKVEGVAASENYGEFIKIASKGKMDLNTYLSKQSERNKLREEGTPDQIAKLDLEDRLASMERELQNSKSESVKRAEQAAKDKETAELKNVQATINPIFNKYRFAGKLGDADAEHKLDKMLWNTARENLAEYESVTPELITKEFKTLSESLGKVIKTQADAEVKKTTTQRRVVAKTAAQVQQNNGVTNSSSKQDLVKHLRGNDLASVFRNWDQFGKLFK